MMALDVYKLFATAATRKQMCQSITRPGLGAALNFQSKLARQARTLVFQGEILQLPSLLVMLPSITALAVLGAALACTGSAYVVVVFEKPDCQPDGYKERINVREKTCVNLKREIRSLAPTHYAWEQQAYKAFSRTYCDDNDKVDGPFSAEGKSEEFRLYECKTFDEDVNSLESKDPGKEKGGSGK